MGRSAAEQAALERAVAAIDRELAANLELTSMFDQTKQAFVLENGQWRLNGDAVRRTLPRVHAFAADVYGRIPEAESAMERRGPANSLKDEDREVVERWEGDARETQRLLRSGLAAPPPGPVARLIDWLFGR